MKDFFRFALRSTESKLAWYFASIFCLLAFVFWEGIDPIKFHEKQYQGDVFNVDVSISRSGTTTAFIGVHVKKGNLLISMPNSKPVTDFYGKFRLAQYRILKGDSISVRCLQQTRKEESFYHRCYPVTIIAKNGVYFDIDEAKLTEALTLMKEERNHSNNGFALFCALGVTIFVSCELMAFLKNRRHGHQPVPDRTPPFP